MGFFNPQLAGQAMIALELMDFDGIETVKEKVQNSQMQSMMSMGMPVPNVSMGGGMGQAQKNAQKATMDSYGERLAQRATPDMNEQ